MYPLSANGSLFIRLELGFDIIPYVRLRVSPLNDAKLVAQKLSKLITTFASHKHNDKVLRGIQRSLQASRTFCCMMYLSTYTEVTANWR